MLLNAPVYLIRRNNSSIIEYRSQNSLSGSIIWTPKRNCAKEHSSIEECEKLIDEYLKRYGWQMNPIYIIEEKVISSKSIVD